MKTLGIYKRLSRSTQLVDAVTMWARLRNISIILKTSLPEFNEVQEIDALYIPICNDFEELPKINTSIPLIIDIDGPLFMEPRRSVLTWYSEFAKNRLVAARMFSINSDTDCENIKFQVPYTHLPLNLRYGERNIVFIDFHGWESMFFSGVDKLFLNKLDIIKSLDPSLESYSYYNELNIGSKVYHEFDDFCHNIIAKMRAIISSHSWINDLDVFNAYISGAPILQVHSNHSCEYFHPMSNAMIYLEPRLCSEFIILKELTDWSKLPSIRNDIPTELYASAFYKTWDLLWDWVLTGSVDRTLMELTMRCK